MTGEQGKGCPQCGHAFDLHCRDRRVRYRFGESGPGCLAWSCECLRHRIVCRCGFTWWTVSGLTDRQLVEGIKSRHNCPMEAIESAGLS